MKALGLALLFGVAFSTPAAAHHGGIIVPAEEEGVYSWEQEGVSGRAKVRFLSYPRLISVGGMTRLVFEVQSLTTGLYLNGLTPMVQILGAEGQGREQPANPVAGSAGYYEVSLRFEQPGSARIQFTAAVDGQPVQVTFEKPVGSAWSLRDPYVLLGTLVLGLAAALTWFGLVLGLQWRVERLATGSA